MHESLNQRHLFSHISAILSKALSLKSYISPLKGNFQNHILATLSKALFPKLYINPLKGGFQESNQPSQRQFPELYKTLSTLPQCRNFSTLPQRRNLISPLKGSFQNYTKPFPHFHSVGTSPCYHGAGIHYGA